jgi:8-oxo-dGTP pyrophosphatase MutT (NUDIX family)
MEELFPICIRSVRIKTPLGDVLRNDVRYYNVIVKNCPPYIVNPNVRDGYIRKTPITRIKNLRADPEQRLSWPDHPKDIFGDYVGAIIILNSLDNKILILRNEHLWGLPKGVRNYTEFHRIKTELTNGNKAQEEVLVFDQVETGIENICRETIEETGISLNPEEVFQWDAEDNSAYTKYYYQLNFTAAEYVDVLQHNGTDHENDEMKWIDYHELDQMLQQHRANRQVKVFNHVTYIYLSQWRRGTCAPP